MLKIIKSIREKNNRKKLFYITLITFLLFLVLLMLSMRESNVIVANNQFLYENKKIVFNTPLVYVGNLKRSATDAETRKINRKLLSIEEASLLNFSKFNEKNKQVEYVKSDMEFTVVGNYKVVPTYITSLFRQTYKMYILKDENGLLSTMPAYENKNPTDIYPVSDFDNSYINIDKKFADSIYKTDEKYPIVVTFFNNSNEQGKRLQKNFYQYIRPYGGGNLIRPYSIENLTGSEQNQCSFSFDAGIDAILYLYTSKINFGIEKIYIDKDKQETLRNLGKNDMQWCSK